MERQSSGCGGDHCHFVAGICFLRLHRFRRHGIIRVSVSNAGFSPPSAARLWRVPQERVVSKTRLHPHVVPELGAG